MSIIQEKDLTGRIISLNLQVCRRFQCGGFSLSPNQPFAVVEPNASHNKIYEGLLDGRLIDVTDQNIKGLAMAGTYTSPATELKGGEKKVYLQVGQDGSLMVVAPKDEKAEEEFEKQIRETGVLKIDDFEIADKPIEGANSRVNSNQASMLIAQMSAQLGEIKSGVEPIRKEN